MEHASIRDGGHWKRPLLCSGLILADDDDERATTLTWLKTTNKDNKCMNIKHIYAQNHVIL